MTTPAPAPDLDPAPAPATRTDRKRAAILDAAGSLFLQHGYGPTSMDDVARTAEVSKQTVYKQFTDKQHLFTAVMQRTVEPMHASLRGLVDASTKGRTVEAELTHYATTLLAEVTRPDVVRLRHVIAAEAERFPEIAAAWHRSGPARNVAELAARLGTLADAGRLRCTEPAVAADQFNWMLLGGPLMESLFTLDRPAVVTESRTAARHVRATVDTFLRAYPPAD